MSATPVCYDCLRRLVHQAAVLATRDVHLRQEVQAAGLQVLEGIFSLDEVTLVMAMELHRIVRDVTGNPDPYAAVKEREMAIMQELLDELRLQQQDDFRRLLRFAAAANSMDFFRSLDLLRADVRREVVFFTDDSGLLEDSVRRSRRILYLGDNAGEMYFDLPLLKWMRRYAEVTYVVKPSPIQNDATVEDMRKSGLESEFGRVITTGLACPGVVLGRASDQFKQEFRDADLVFAKGMGHWEGLSELPPAGKVFHCLMAKCQPVAHSLTVPLNAYVARLR